MPATPARGATPSFDELVEALRDDQAPIISPSKFAKAFRMQLREVAADAGVPLDTLRRRPDAPTTQRFLQDILRVLSAANALQSELGKSMYWVRNQPIPAFGHKTASELVGEGRADDVISYIASTSVGFAG